MQNVKGIVGSLLGLSTVEVDVMIQSTIQTYTPVLLTIARLLFVIGFVCCLITYPLPAIFIGILGYYLIELETKVDMLEHKLKEQNKHY